MFIRPILFASALQGLCGLMVCPRYSTLAIIQFHFFCFSATPTMKDVDRTCSMSLTSWLLILEKVVISSRSAKQDFHAYLLSVMSRARRDVVSTSMSQTVIWLNRFVSAWLVEKVSPVFLFVTIICQNLKLVFKFETTVASAKNLISSSIHEKRYVSQMFTALILRF